MVWASGWIIPGPADLGQGHGWCCPGEGRGLGAAGSVLQLGASALAVLALTAAAGVQLLGPLPWDPRLRPGPRAWLWCVCRGKNRVRPPALDHVTWVLSCHLHQIWPSCLNVSGHLYSIDAGERQGRAGLRVLAHHPAACRSQAGPERARRSTRLPVAAGAQGPPAAFLGAAAGSGVEAAPHTGPRSCELRLDPLRRSATPNGKGVFVGQEKA